MNPLSPKPTGNDEQPTSDIHQDIKSSPFENKVDKVSNKVDKSHQVTTHKDINANPETKNPKVSHVYHKILQHQESPDELDISEEVIEEMSKALDKIILPMSKDSAFYNTDLIIIDDAYKGNMPLNGIKKSELEHIEQLFKNICAGKEKIKVISTGANDPFKAETENLIKTLLTRNIGRKLVQKANDNSFATKIDLIAGERCVLALDNTTHEVEIFLGGEDIYQLAYDPSGNYKAQTAPLLIGLAHELIHVTHLPFSEESLPTFSSKYDEMEEQLTITGLKQDLSLENDKSEDDSWEPSESLTQDLRENYDELNEWNITAALTDSQNVYYPRFSHRGFRLNTPFPLDVTQLKHLSSLEKYGEPELEKLREDIRTLVLYGALSTLDEIYKLNIIDIPKLFENETPPLIFAAILSGEVNMVRFLCKNGFDLNCSLRDENPLIYLLDKIEPSQLLEHFDTIKFLIENNVSIDSVFSTLKFSDRLWKKEEYRPLMKLIFKHYIKSSDLIELSDILETNKATKDPNMLKFGENILECASDNFVEFSTVSLSLEEISMELNRYHHLLKELDKLGIDTSDLDDKILDLLTNLS